MRMRRSPRASTLPTSSPVSKTHPNHLRQTAMRTMRMRLCKAALACPAQCPIRMMPLSPRAFSRFSWLVRRIWKVDHARSNAFKTHLLTLAFLLDAKATFQAISTIHVYSVQPTGLQDLNVLTDVCREIATAHAQDDPLECGQQWGMIQNRNVKVDISRTCAMTRQADTFAAEDRSTPTTTPGCFSAQGQT